MLVEQFKFVLEPTDALNCNGEPVRVTFGPMVTHWGTPADDPVPSRQLEGVDTMGASGNSGNSGHKALKFELMIGTALGAVVADPGVLERSCCVCALAGTAESRVAAVKSSAARERSIFMVSKKVGM